MVQVFEQNWEDNFPKVFIYKSEDSSVHRAIREFYYGKSEDNQFVSTEKEGQLSKMFGDRMWVVKSCILQRNIVGINKYLHILLITGI